MSADVLAQAQQVARDVLSNVNADQLEGSTPCANWNVGQVIDHIVGAQHWARQAVQGVDMSDTGEGSSQGDFVAAFDNAAQNTLDAFNEDGALGRTVNAGFGDMPAMALLGMASMDTFAHAWDVAKATGQDTNLAPELASGLLDQARKTIQDSFRTDDGSIFGPVRTAADDAPAADQLAAFLGRTV